MTNSIIQTFGNQLRVRVSGLLVQNDKILLVKHTSLGPNGYFWSPPGGGVNFSESAEESLKREFEEETGLKIDVKDFLLVNEFLQPPLHAIELFFLVDSEAKEAKKGSDPELSAENQIIQDLAFLSLPEIKKLPLHTFHSLFNLVDEINDLKKLKGFYSFIPDKK